MAIVLRKLQAVAQALWLSPLASAAPYTTQPTWQLESGLYKYKGGT